MAFISCVNCGSSDHKKLTTSRGDKKIGAYNGKFPVVLCRNCGLCFLNPQPSHEEYVRYYTAKNKNKKFELEAFYEYKNYQTHYVRWLIKNADIPKNAQILELGCGKGSLLRSFKTEFGFTNITGLEISPTYAKLAEKTGAKIYNEDILENTLPKNNYDVIFALALLEHMNDPKVLLNEVNRLLRPNGYAYFMTPDLYGMTFRNKFFKFVHPYYFSESAIRSLLEQCGFEIVAIQSTPVFDGHTSFMNPENLVAGELHTIAMKACLPAGRSPRKRTLPIREDYKKVTAHFWKQRLRDAPYEFMYKLMYSKYGKFIRKHRTQATTDPYLDYENYWSNF